MHPQDKKEKNWGLNLEGVNCKCTPAGRARSQIFEKIFIGGGGWEWLSG